MDGQSVAIEDLAGDQSIGFNVHVVAIEMCASGGHTVDIDEDLWARGRRVKHLQRDGLEEETFAELIKRHGIEARVRSGEWVSGTRCEITLWHVNIHVLKYESESPRIILIILASDTQVLDSNSTGEEWNIAFKSVLDGQEPISKFYILSGHNCGWIKRIGTINPITS